MIELKPIIDKDGRKTDKVEVITELPEPVLGHVIIKAIIEDAQSYLDKKKLSDSAAQLGFVIPHGQMAVDKHTGQEYYKMYDNDATVPITKGVVIKLAPDVWGESFKRRFGSDVGQGPKVNDLIMFFPHKSTAIDPEGYYHMLADIDICGIYRTNN